jgi:hypothetical protein
MKKNPDGSLTIYLRNKSPGKDKEANWLPVPAGPLPAPGPQADPWLLVTPTMGAQIVSNLISVERRLKLF